MTLIVGCIEENFIGLATDRRLTTSVASRIVNTEDTFNKTIKAICKDGLCFISFTGLASIQINGQKVMINDWLLEILSRQKNGILIKDCFRIIHENLILEKDKFIPRCNTFVFVGHKNPEGHFICTVSNCGDTNGFKVAKAGTVFNFYSSDKSGIFLFGDTLNLETHKLFKKRKQILARLLNKGSKIMDISKEMARLIQIAHKLRKTVSEESLVLVGNQKGTLERYFPKNINDGRSYSAPKIQDTGGGILVVSEAIVDNDESRVEIVKQELLKDNSTQIFPIEGCRILLRLKKESDNK